MSSAPGRREVAHRLFAAEFDDAEFSYSESDEERAPNYVVTPTGARVNRLFLVGVLTEVEQVNEEMLRARVVDPTGAFVVYAGQYQPDELAFLERVEPPTFLAVTGKARTFEPEDGDRVFTSVRPESINEVDAETRDRWVVNATERTLERVGTMAAAIETGLQGASLEAALLADGVDESLAAGVPLALDHYGTTPEYLAALREVALDAARLVADRADEVRSLDVAPGEGAGDAGALADRTIDVSDVDVESAAGAEAATEAAAAEPADADSGTDVESATDAEPTADAEPAADAESEPAADSGAETDAGMEADSEPGAEATEAAEAGAAEVETATAGGGAETESAGDATGDPTDDIGEFEPGEFGDEPDEDTGDEDTVPDEGEPGTEEPPEDVLDEEERREIEEEYGTDFSTASEVDEPGEADVEPSEPATESRAAADADPGAEPEQEPETTPEEEAEAVDEPAEDETAEPTPEAEPTEPTEPTADEEPTEADAEEAEPTEADDDAAEEVPIDEAVMEEMRALDDGDGADREALIERVCDRTGAGADAVESAIQELLMSGQCYEPDDERLKPI